MHHGCSNVQATEKARLESLYRALYSSFSLFSSLLGTVCWVEGVAPAAARIASNASNRFCIDVWGS